MTNETHRVADRFISASDLRRAANECSGYEPSYSLLLIAAELGADRIERLEEVLGQLLNDMGEDGLSVCQQAKDEAWEAFCEGHSCIGSEPCRITGGECPSSEPCWQVELAQNNGRPVEAIAKRIDGLVEQHGSLRAAAKVLGCDAGYLSRLRAGEKRNPSSALLKRMGLKVRTVYTSAGQSQKPTNYIETSPHTYFDPRCGIDTRDIEYCRGNFATGKFKGFPRLPKDGIKAT